MKKKFKRITAGLLALMTVFTSLFSGGIKAEAASSTANLRLWDCSVKEHPAIPEFNSYTYTGEVMYAMIDGSTAYCMNYAKSARGEQTMESSSSSKTSLTTEQEKLLSYCLYYGYGTTTAGSPTNTQSNEFIATQAMVWIIVKGIYGTSSADSAAQKVCQCAPSSSEAYSYYETLRDKINASYNVTVPSFASTTKSGAKTYELAWNEAKQRFEVTLNDTNNALANFNLSASGYYVERSGNTITIFTENVSTATTLGTFESNQGAVVPTTNCVYWTIDKENYQEFISERPQVEPVSAYINLKTESIGYGEILKVDESTNTPLSGAVYGIYSDSSCSTVVDQITTDANGKAKSKELVAGTYYVKEIKAPDGFVKSSAIHTLTVKPGQTTSFTVTDKEQKGAITIYKEGEVLTGWNGNQFVYEIKKLQGASFKVTAGEDIYTATGKKVYSKGDVVADSITTGSDGYVVLTDLYLGTYEVTEIASINGYTINTTPQTVKIQYKDQTVEVQYESATIKNARQTAHVSVEKVDSVTENPLSGGEYTLYAGSDITNYTGQVIVTKGTALQTVTTDGTGKAFYTLDIPIANDYYICESKAPKGYVKNSDDVYSFTFGYLSETSASTSFTHTFENDRTTAKIHLSKVDADTEKAVPQGDASLEGAVYGLYAKENIYHPDGRTGLLFAKDALVATMKTDENGEAEISNLYLGNYYVKEITPSEGYLLDEEKHEVICDYEGDMVAEVSRSTVSKESVKRQPFVLIKVSDDGKETDAKLVEGAGFTVYLKSSLEVKADGSYDFENAAPVLSATDGTTEIFTDENGYAVSEALPYGTYIVVESTTPHNLEAVKPFEIKITENKPDQPQVWRVLIDREFAAKLRIIKRDSDTGSTVLQPNAEFKIYDLEKEEYVTMVTTYPSKVNHTSFFTDEDGDLILPEKVGIGTYRIEEVAAPYGYVVNKDYITVEVDTNTFYEIDPDTLEAIITVEYEDAPVTGKLVIEKKGEVLDAFKGGLFASLEEKDFAYVEGSLEGAEFEIYAAEDIYTADMQLDGNGVRTKYFNKGELVATVTTDKDGKATVEDLPLGSYKIVEVQSPFGYILNEEEQVVTFVYVDDKSPVIEESIVFSNERQKLSLNIEKSDAETAHPIPNAVFGLYADEDIVNAEGDVIIKSGTLLEVAVSDENGEVTFTKDYPFAKYFAKEMETPAGYVSSDSIVLFDAKYQGQDVRVAEYISDIVNIPTTFEFTKTDITSGEELAGATLTVFDKDGNVIDTWSSVKEEAHVITKLVVGETYTLREEFAPYGYLVSNDIEFTVEDTEEIQMVEMKDEVPTGTIIINKDGEFVTDISLIEEHWYDFIFEYFMDAVEGVVFEVYAAEDIVSADETGTIYYEKDAFVGTILTDENGIGIMEDLPLGEYYLIETETAEGFVLNSTPIGVDLTYVDQNTEVVYAGMNLVNERQKVKVKVSKTDAETGEVLEGSVFGLFAKTDIVNKDGEVIVKADTLIEKRVTDANGDVTFVSDIPLGMYYVVEMESPSGYVKSDEVFEIDATYQGADIDVIAFETEFKNYPIKLDISKTDVTGENELEGATLTILDENGNVIDSWVSDGTEHRIERIPVGTYTLIEEISPYGYVIATDIEFEVTETVEIQKVSMIDELVYGKIIIHKTDDETGTGIEGVEFEILDKAGNVVEKLVTDGYGYAESKLLEIATFENGAYKEDIDYYVVETKAADGYILDSTIHEVTLSYEGEAPDVVKCTLELTNTAMKVEGPKTGDTANPWLWGGIGLVSLAGVLLLLGKKKKTTR